MSRYTKQYHNFRLYLNCECFDTQCVGIPMRLFMLMLCRMVLCAPWASALSCMLGKPMNLGLVCKHEQSCCEVLFVQYCKFHDQCRSCQVVPGGSRWFMHIDLTRNIVACGASEAAS